MERHSLKVIISDLLSPLILHFLFSFQLPADMLASSFMEKTEAICRSCSYTAIAKTTEALPVKPSLPPSGQTKGVQLPTCHSSLSSSPPPPSVALRFLLSICPSLSIESLPKAHNVPWFLSA